MAAQAIPRIRLNNNHDIPVIGLGTWKLAPAEATEVVKTAIDAGYRHIDCAKLYLNELNVGQAIRAKIDEGVVQREDLFVTSKLWANSSSRAGVISALKKTLADLGTNYVDLYLIHSPTALKEGEELFPTNPDGSLIFSDIDYLETWKGMEDALSQGLAHSIGVSNFNVEQLERLLSAARIPPAVNQIEVSPYFTNARLVDFCISKGVGVVGYSCFGGSPADSPELIDKHQPQILQEELLQELAKKYGKGVGQIILRWAIQRNVIVIPKSVAKKRIEDNINIVDFSLTNEEVNQINGLNRNIRTVHFTWAKNHKFYPFKDELAEKP